ncbi:MAG: AAA family ATPase [Dehalococcoidia bacterium]|nr:AAA family ATPase [Dehalococcoidia bacterium]
MLTSLRLVNFKNFADETLKLGPFTVIVGANASGKSNIRDAFRFLHGIGRGYTLADILGGKYGPGGQREWDQIRGAPKEVGRLDPEFNLPPSTFSLSAGIDRVDGERSVYSISIWFDPFGPQGFRITEESLISDARTIFASASSEDPFWMRLRFGEDITQQPPGRISSLQPALSQFFQIYKSMYRDFVTDPGIMQALQNMSFLELAPERMREPSIPGATTLGDYGQNLPSVLESICADADRKQTLLSWFEELTPMDVAGFGFPRDPSGRVHLQIVERNGRKVSAYSASDGTLRFLGILAVLLNEDAGGTYFFEEIDNGIHPNRLWLLLELIERQTAKGNIQVITTTHNPALLAWMNDETFENTSVVYRDEYWSDSVIRPIAGLYNLRELRKSHGMEGLLTEGWLETAMKFSEGDYDTDHLDDDDEDDWGMEEE